MEMTLNLDCIWDRDKMSPVYANLIGLCILPIILMLLVVLIWTVIRLCRKDLKWKNQRHYSLGTITNLLFLVHATILKVTI